jgi:spermidine/putrescine transport system ATP-binding protein
VLLLDEPLGALDARLRKSLQVELKALQQDIGVTFVFVTHDQEEALTMSDRVAVMNNGRVEQAGSPRGVYENPETTFVADFLGVSNLLPVEGVGGDGSASVLRIGERTCRAEQGDTSARGELKAMIRPERIRLEPQGTPGDNRLPGMVENAVFLGGSYEVHVRVVGGEVLRVTIPNESGVAGTELEPGTPVTLHLPPDSLRVLKPESEPEPEAEEEPEPEAAATPST